MKKLKTGLSLLLVITNLVSFGQKKGEEVPQAVMERIYNEVRTPYKYGIVLPQPDQGRMVDSPTIYRKDSTWFMSYIIFDGKGYETWLAQSDDLLHWKTAGKLMSFTDTGWDATQKAGYVSLIDTEWGGSYAPERYNDRYWLSYLGGSEKGYEAGRLGVGIATTADLTKAVEVDRQPSPVLSAIDPDARPYDNNTIYKSLIIHDKAQQTGYPFVMYYNAKGNEKDAKGNGFESIAMAVSTDMVTWKRHGQEPLITRKTGICGDAQIAKIGDVYVMFYFGAFWKPGAFERFACSYDLLHWTDWQGPDLIAPSAPFDKTYAHKPWVIKWNGVVYHFYNAVGTSGRVIALATSHDLGQSDIRDK
nr:glycosylase [uncultured Arsenicibacter sp.]